jgi:putative ATPase
MYWLARMVAAGEDPHFIFRRMLISACEDTGLADPNAITIINSCSQAFDRVGMPEGRYFLAHAALYLATAPKSNSSMAFFDALASVEKEDSDVPNHLKDSNRDAEGFGHGSGYLYPHAYKDHWVAQQYLPNTLMGRVFYTPSTQGYENQIRNEVLSRRELQIAAILEKPQPTEIEIAQTGSKNTSTEDTKQNTSEFFANPISEWWISEHFKTGIDSKSENLTFSPVDTARETALDKADKQWRQRLDSNRAEILLGIRDTMSSLANLARHHRCLIWNADDGLLLWDIARKTPEGITCGVCRTQKGKEVLEQYSRTLGNLDKPILQFRPETVQNDFMTPKNFFDILVKFQYNGTIFDRIFFRDPFISKQSIKALVEAFSAVTQITHKGKAFTDMLDEDNIDEDEKSIEYESPFAKDWKIVISQKIPSSGQRISALIKEQVLSPNAAIPFMQTLSKMEEVEKSFFGDTTNNLFNWNTQSIIEEFRNAGFEIKCASQLLKEKRRISQQEIHKWFDMNHSVYGRRMQESLTTEELEKIIHLLENAATNTIFNWQTEFAFFTISKAEN